MFLALIISILIIAAFIFSAIFIIRKGYKCVKNGKKAKGLLLALLGIVWATIIINIIIPFLYFANIGFLIFKPQFNLAFDEKIKSPDGTSWFALYHDYGGFGDPEWDIFKIPIEEIPEKLKIPCGYNFADSSKSDFWKKRMLMWNWSEGGNHTSNPHIKMFKNRYIVFIRGGLYHGLYDIEEDRTLITDESPWHSFMHSDGRKSSINRDKEIDQWVRDNLHNPIKEIIENDQ